VFLSLTAYLLDNLSATLGQFFRRAFWRISELMILVDVASLSTYMSVITGLFCDMKSLIRSTLSNLAVRLSESSPSLFFLEECQIFELRNTKQDLLSFGVFRNKF